MPRSLQITVSSELTDALIEKIKPVDGLLSLRVQRNISLKPRGDVISVEATSSTIHHLMRLLDEEGLGERSGLSVTSGDMASIVAPGHSKEIAIDDSELTWEEMELSIARESNMTVNGLLAMILSGTVAALGISTNAIHIVIGAMVIAPGFEPITRVALGIVSHGQSWRRGAIDTARGYGVLLAAATVVALGLRAVGKDPLVGEATYLAEGALVKYWTTITMVSLLSSAAAAIAGAVLIAAHRSVLTAGVMVALALIPSATVTGMALACGDLRLAGLAFIRWLLDVTLVLVLSLLVLGWKRAAVHHRVTASGHQ